MTLPRHSFIITLLTLLPIITVGQDSSMVTQYKIIQNITEETHIREQINELIKEFHNQFSQNPLGLEPSKNKQMMDLFMDAFDEEAILNNFQKIFRKEYNPRYADTTTEWLNKESTQKISNSKKVFYTLQGIRKRIISKYELEQNPPANERKEIINTLDQQTSVSKVKVNSSITMFRAVFMAFNHLSDQQMFNDSQINNFVINYQNRIAPQINREVTDELLTMYHEIGDDTLRKYILFYTTDSGHWLNNTISTSIDSAFAAASDRFLSSVKNMKSNK